MRAQARCLILATGLLAGLAAPAQAESFADPLFWLPDLPAVVEEGGNALLVSGYAWHDPSVYGKNNGLNALSWGGGYARWYDHADGRTDMLFAMGFSDSNRNFQFAGGVGHVWTVARMEALTLALGYTAGVTSRRDIWNNAPFHFLLPLVDLRLFDRLDIYFTYIPPLPSEQLNGNNGSVAFVFAGFRF